MKRKFDTLTILFVSVVTIIIWLWAAGRMTKDFEITTTLYFSPPEGSIITSPQSEPISLILSGPGSAIEPAKKACEGGIYLPLKATDGEVTLQDIPAKINALDVFDGAKVKMTTPSSFKIEVQSMTLVEATVEAKLPNVIVSGDITIDPTTVTLSIPTRIRKNLPEAIIVYAVVSESALEQMQPGVTYYPNAVLRLPSPFDASDVTIIPNRVKLSFKIQSKTQKTIIPTIRILIASPAEDYAAYTVSLPRSLITNVTIEADTEIISGIESGDVTVFAFVRLASRDMEQQIQSKTITTFLAIMPDGTGREVKVTVDDLLSLDVELQIEPISTSP